MEIYKTKINGSEVSVIFTGKNYFFHNSLFGWLCIAERTEESYKNIGKREDNLQSFVLHVGNEHTIGSSMTDNIVAAMAKKFPKE